ncbi:hypothetical protein R3P38DRAFT_2890448 [Favolaschia claudopus]|uniref:Uncharacterized protein n=1 Tax=Favolaschia claudopus TaxID=2862362 RepID=A0AAW0CVN9_9AGAR
MLMPWLKKLRLRLALWLYFKPRSLFLEHTYFLRLLLRSPHRLRIAWLLLRPTWKWSLPIDAPLSVHTLQQNPGIVQQRRAELEMTRLRYTWTFCARDTPLRALYRLYECTVDYDANEMMLDSQYWFHQQAHWRLVEVPDPEDPDPTRYAVIASLVEDLVDSFNYKIKLGLRRGITFERPWLIKDFKDDPHPPFECAPLWTSRVGPLTAHLALSRKCKPTPAFVRRNIKANMNQLRNI